MNHIFNKTSILLLLVIAFSVVHAQNSLFEFDPGNTIPSPPPFVISTHDIALDFDMIKGFPESIQLTFADETSTVIIKGSFDPRSGYEFRDDETDPPGTPPFWIDPRANQEDFSFKWSGSNDEYDIVITAYKGLLSATISGNTKRYVIKKQKEGPYQIHHVDLRQFPMHDSSITETVKTSDNQSNNYVNHVEDKPYTSHLKSFNYENKSNLQTRDTINPTVVDMLIVYNDAARIEAGGSAGDPNDTRY